MRIWTRFSCCHTKPSDTCSTRNKKDEISTSSSGIFSYKKPKSISLGCDLKHWFEVAGDERQLVLCRREPCRWWHGNCVWHWWRRETSPGELSSVRHDCRAGWWWVAEPALRVRAGATVRAQGGGSGTLVHLLVVTESHSVLVDSFSA